MAGRQHFVEGRPKLCGHVRHDFLHRATDMQRGWHAVHLREPAVHDLVAEIGIEERKTHRGVFHQAVDESDYGVLRPG